MELLKNLRKVLLRFTGKNHYKKAVYLALLEDREKVRYYRWVNLKKLRKILKKHKIISGDFIGLSQVSWIQECPANGCDYNVFKVCLKNGECYHLKAKTILGSLLKDSKHVFTKDSVDWAKIYVVKFLPIGSKFYYDNKRYELTPEDNKLVLKRCSLND